MSIEDIKLAQRISNLRTEARYNLQRKKEARAREVATEADALLQGLQTAPDELSDLYAGMAALWQDLGEPERAETWIVKALDLEASLPERRPVTLGTQHLFYAKFLFHRKRFAEAAKHAREGLAIYAEGCEPGDRELAFIRQDMAPVIAAGDLEPS